MQRPSNRGTLQTGTVSKVGLLRSGFCYIYLMLQNSNVQSLSVLECVTNIWLCRTQRNLRTERALQKFLLIEMAAAFFRTSPKRPAKGNRVLPCISTYYY